MNKQLLIVDEESEGVRIDQFLAEMLDGFSRSYLQKLIKEKQITVNGSEKKVSYTVLKQDLIEIVLPEPKVLSIKAEAIPLDIVFEDDSLIVVNKPSGMVVHPAAGNETGTLVNALMHHCKGNLSTINGIIRPGIVHRIDKNTSGLLVVAKNDKAHRGLAEQLSAHTMSRIYEAVAVGQIKDERIMIDAPIGRHPQHRQKMAVVPQGRQAVTHLKVKERFMGFTYLEAKLETGRTHQIRVHLAYISHPLLGDDKYGGSSKKFNLQGQVLHAKSLGFNHPVNKNEMVFETELPVSFQKILLTLRNLQQ
jgi:23S rRNA pseudouridine1911/1915/1917 synthase